MLSSADGQNAYQIARNLGCNPQTARNAIHKFNEEGLEEALRRGSKRPHTVYRTFDEKGMEALREMLHRSPREFGKDSSLWTMELAAEVSFEEGLTKESGYLGKLSPGYLGQDGGALAKSQALAHLSRPAICEKKEGAMD